MRILHVTDFHFNLTWFEWLSAHCTEYDAVCFTGDLVNLFLKQFSQVSDSRPSSLARTLRPQMNMGVREQARWVRKWLSTWPKEVSLLLCTGNHDFWPSKDDIIDTDDEGGWLRKTRKPGVIYVDGLVIHQINGIRFVCVPWTHVPKPVDREPIIALVHAPPEGTPVASEKSGGVGGSADVAHAVRELPNGSILLCGHVHQPNNWFAPLTNLFGDRIWAFNPGMAGLAAAIPNHIIIDTIQRTAQAYHEGHLLFPLNLEST